MRTHISLPARQHAQITVSDVCVTRGATPVLRHVDLTVTPASRTAIVGENGRGKSTLLHVMAGSLPPTSGTVRRVGALAIAEQEMGISTERRTVGDVLAEALAAPLAALKRLDVAAAKLGDGSATDTNSAADQSLSDASAEYVAALGAVEVLDAWDVERRLQIAVEALGAVTDKSRLLSELSVGQRYRVRLACVLASSAYFLLLDEPTNHLDVAGLKFMTDRLRSWHGGVVVVSHDRAFLADFAQTIVDVDPSKDGRPRVYGGGFEGYRTARLAERQRWEEGYERQQSDHERLAEDLSAAQNRLVTGWRPEKGTPKHGRATRAGGLVRSVRRREEALAAHAVSLPQPPQILRFPELPESVDSPVVDVSKVSVAGRLRGPISFSVPRRGRMVLTGPNGAGKSTLLSVISGDVVPDTGTVSVRQGTRVGFLRQESALPEGKRAAEVYEARREASILAGVGASGEAVSIRDLGLLCPAEMNKRVEELSTGQRRRLDLALVLAGWPHILLLDEPTNHLSIALVDKLTEALMGTPACVIVATHDRQLLADTADWERVTL
ncbi:MAG: ATP-binding cassette domain-containing protein [Bifidobacteriaceae bacterium]|jgi:macrolide transport system ATP-binding/permease protein|nr:ATP-binding cassette domain-containing protein [Bifidobacteriaceae bacterium]